MTKAARGREMEDRACGFLESRGLDLIERNYQTRRGEIDLVMRDGGQLVFVEVRFRASRRYGGALASVDRHKQVRLIAAARHYILARDYRGEARFDVVALEGPDQIQWIRDAFGVTDG